MMMAWQLVLLRRCRFVVRIYGKIRSTYESREGFASKWFPVVVFKRAQKLPDYLNLGGVQRELWHLIRQLSREQPSRSWKVIITCKIGKRKSGEPGLDGNCCVNSAVYTEQQLCVERVCCHIRFSNIIKQLDQHLRLTSFQLSQVRQVMNPVIQTPTRYDIEGIRPVNVSTLGQQVRNPTQNALLQPSQRNSIFWTHPALRSCHNTLASETTFSLRQLRFSFKIGGSIRIQRSISASLIALIRVHWPLTNILPPILRKPLNTRSSKKPC